MADNVAITAGSGTTIATDDAGAGGHVQIVKLAISTDGSATPIPADGTDGMLVNLGANNDVTVTGTVTANLAAGTNNIGDVDVLSVVPGTGATALGKAIDTAAGATDTGVAVLAVRDDALSALTPIETDYVPLRTDANGALWVIPSGTVAVSGTVTANLAAGTNNIGDVDVLSLPALAAGTNYVGKVRITDGTNDLSVDTVHGDAESNTENHLDVAAKLMAFNGTDWDRLRSDITNGLDVDVTRLPALPAGTNNIGDVDILSIAAGDNNIGNVDIVTMPNVTLAATTNTIEVVGDIAHDTGVGGNPVQVAGAAVAMADSAPGNRVSAAADVTRLATSLDGGVFVHPHGPQIWSYHLNTSTAQTDTSVKGAPGAGLSLYVTDIIISLGAATALNVFFEEGASTVLGPFYLEAVNGRGLHLRFATPKKITANTALTVTSSASVAHAIDVTGFTAPG